MEQSNTDDFDAVIKAWLDNLAADICPTCLAPIESYAQVGRCVYADPCKHRLYQGKVPAGKRKS